MHVHPDLDRVSLPGHRDGRYSRRIVGWSMEHHFRTDLVLEALNMAILAAQTSIGDSSFGPGLVSTRRSDLGCGVRRPSMGSVGDCYDNAMCESFFATLECELLQKRRFKTRGASWAFVFAPLSSAYVFDCI